MANHPETVWEVNTWSLEPKAHKCLGETAQQYMIETTWFNKIEERRVFKVSNDSRYLPSRREALQWLIDYWTERERFLMSKAADAQAKTKRLFEMMDEEADRD